MSVPLGLASARAMARAYSQARHLAPLRNGRFDRSAIMKLAVLAARHHQKRYGCSWREAMSVALKATWQMAQAVKASLH